MKEVEFYTRRCRLWTKLLRVCGLVGCALGGLWILGGVWGLWSQPALTHLTAHPVSPTTSVATNPGKSGLATALTRHALRAVLTPSVTVVVAAVSKAPELELVGTLMGAETPEAYIRSKETRKLMHVHIGSKCGELIVKEIQEGRVVLEGNGNNLVLTVVGKS